MKRWLKRIAVSLVALLAVAVLIGASWEAMGRRSATTDHPIAGALVDIGGRRIHIDCRGTGSPTVVLIHGLDTGGAMSWRAVHDPIAKTTRTCAYSRAGIMWSDPGPALTAKGVAEDLHAALEKAGERPPFVLVGHSLGGPYAMTYTKYFGDQVAGMVMVDASHPDQLERLGKIAPAAGAMPVTAMKVTAALGWTGIVRFVGMRAPAQPNQTAEDARTQAAFISTSIHGAVKELEALPATLAEAGTFRTLGDRPLVVLTAMKPMGKAELAALKVDSAKAHAFKDAWRAMHVEEASWSTRAEHSLVFDASHYIQFDRPDMVIGAVQRVVDGVRAAAVAKDTVPAVVH
jgi:pimeloyl-ACP methyl ester carboxylesterase